MSGTNGSQGGEVLRRQQGAPRGTPGVLPPAQLRELSGMDLFRGMFAGELPSPPISEVLDFEPVEMAPGRAVFVGRPQRRFYNPIGSVHGGYAATLLDSCMSCAVQTLLKAGQGYTTVEFKISLLRPMTDQTGEVRAEGTVINVGSRIGTAEGRIVDAAGKIYAHGTTTCLIFQI